MKRVRMKISTLSLQVTSDWIDIRTRLFSIPQTWRFVVFGRITGVTGVDRSGLGGKSGGDSVYNFFIRAAAFSTHICISILPRSVGKRNWGWKTLLAAYIYRSETGGVGPNRDRGSATTVFCSYTPYMRFNSPSHI